MRPRLFSLLFLMACGGAAATPKNAGPAQSRVSRLDARKAVAVTVYNDGFGLVREVRDVDLGTGRVSLEFRDVSSHIEPDTVHVKSLSKGNPLSILEQNYRYDLLSPQKLLEKYEGKKIKLYRWNKETGKDEEYEAEVLSVNENQPGQLLTGGVDALPEQPVRVFHPGRRYLGRIAQTAGNLLCFLGIDKEHVAQRTPPRTMVDGSRHPSLE